MCLHRKYQRHLHGQLGFVGKQPHLWEHVEEVDSWGRCGWHRMKHRWELSNEELSRVFTMKTRSKIAKWRSQEKFGKGWISSSRDSSAENVQVSYCLPRVPQQKHQCCFSWVLTSQSLPFIHHYTLSYLWHCNKGGTGGEVNALFQLVAVPSGFIASDCVTSFGFMAPWDSLLQLLCPWITLKRWLQSVWRTWMKMERKMQMMKTWRKIQTCWYA